MYDKKLIFSFICQSKFVICCFFFVVICFLLLLFVCFHPLESEKWDVIAFKPIFRPTSARMVLRAANDSLPR